jgi:hypothetical protein
MARALIRLRHDGIYEIVSQRRPRKLAFAFEATLAASVLGLVLAAMLSSFVSKSRALGAGVGAALAAVALLGFLFSSRPRRVAGPLASTVQLRPAASRVRPLATEARDAGA